MALVQKPPTPSGTVVSRAVVVAIGINALGYLEVLGNSFGEGFASAVGDSECAATIR
jgi:hypothetical protein